MCESIFYDHISFYNSLALGVPLLFGGVFLTGLIISIALLQLKLITPPRNRGGVIFSLQFVCVCVCLSVCVSVGPALLVNKIPAERMHRFERGFR